MQDANMILEAGRDTRPAFIKVWDPFVRIFHWLLVAFFTGAWITADEWDRAHEIAGYIIIGLIGLRIIWGLVGSHHARFSDFLFKPSVVMKYLKDAVLMRAKRFIGHNPAGGFMVLAMLLSLIAVSATGIMMTTDLFWGKDWVEDLHEVAANLTLGLVFLHVTGVLIASIQHRENLIRSMFTGLKRK
jgi:cytochrome b